MAVAPIFPVLLLAVVTRCRCDHGNGFNTHGGNSASQFGTLLKPPPPPLPPVPVPFHKGPERNHRQNSDIGYQYQSPPPPPLASSDFKFPAPFYKQYNFNFVPPPQPFSTTPSPSLFQKVSGWLFPSQQTSYAGSSVFNNVGPIKKDCNPCNLVPWLPVIRYNLGAKNVYQNSLPTYGPPSPTAYANMLKVQPHPFNSQNLNKRPPQLLPSVPHTNYGPPNLSYNGGAVRIVSSTYGPPSATHTLDVVSPNPPSSTYSQPSSSYGVPSSSFSLPSNSLDSQFLSTPSQEISNNFYNVASSTFQPPSSSYGTPSPSYGVPSSSYGTPSSSYGTPSSSYGTPSSSYGTPSPLYGTPSPSYGTPSPSYATPSPSYGTPSPSYGTPSPGYETPRPVITNFQPVTPQYEPGTLNKELPPQNDVELLENITPNGELQLPKVSHPTTFKNSYGEPITNKHLFDISYPVSATAAESSKIKTQVLLHDNKKPTPNNSFALANPAPFTLNRGRNIHTLQPVALPNLSVSPLPPIFNARPFRPVPPQFTKYMVQGINQMQQSNSNVHVEQSIPLAEFTHSVDYPATIIQSPIIEIDPPSNFNQSKAYRNIPNSYVVDEIRDISSQASEDHISATKSVPDASFESTGGDVGNELYDNTVPADLKSVTRVPTNHKFNFADLRGVNDDDVDKYRTESNLQNIDSPLLYLKPNTPHKNHGNFILAISSPIPENEYEIYDDIPTTVAPQIPTITTSWDESRTEYKEGPLVQKNTYKPKIVQIIVPYTTGKKQTDSNEDFVQMSQDWPSTPKNEYQARKVPSNTESSYVSPITENYNTVTTTTEDTQVLENYDSDRSKDFYDVKEPPFDIIKLQHTIDDWTEQEYSKQYKSPQRTHSNEKHAKQIPDDYFTTTLPANDVTTTSNYNYEFYDHEGSSSVQNVVTDDSNNTFSRPRKEYNVIERTKNRHNSGKNEELDEVQKLHIYTAASSFRTTSTSTTTTPAPWGKIQTSISPLTKEKVYVVTSKPWRDMRNVSTEWYQVESFESKKTSADSDFSASSNLPFKSPRFMNRPSFGFTSGGKIESDSSYGFSKSWYQSINELETQKENNSTSFQEANQQRVTTNLDEDNTTASPHNG